MSEPVDVLGFTNGLASGALEDFTCVAVIIAFISAIMAAIIFIWFSRLATLGVSSSCSILSFLVLLRVLVTINYHLI